MLQQLKSDDGIAKQTLQWTLQGCRGRESSRNTWKMTRAWSTALAAARSTTPVSVLINNRYGCAVGVAGVGGCTAGGQRSKVRPVNHVCLNYPKITTSGFQVQPDKILWRRQRKTLCCREGNQNLLFFRIFAAPTPGNQTVLLFFTSWTDKARHFFPPRLPL